MKNPISVRQLCVTWFTALLALAAAAGGVDWRGALLAVPVAALAAWAGCSAARRTGGLLRGASGFCGKALSILYIVWGVWTAGLALALCGERLAAAGHGGAGWQMALAALPVLWLAVSKADAFVRAGEIFYLAMLVTAAAVLLLGAGQVEWRWLLKEGAGIWPSFLTAAGIGCMGVYALLLWDGKERGESGRWVRWALAGGLVLAAMAAVTAGSLSPALADAVERPFFVMTVGLGRTARAEALVAVLWLMSDVTLAGLMLHGGRSLCKNTLGWRREKIAGAALWAAALAVGFCVECFWEPERLLYDVLPWGGVLLGGIGPAALWVFGKKAPET